jgi:hypothetical protein
MHECIRVHTLVASLLAPGQYVGLLCLQDYVSPESLAQGDLYIIVL